MCNEENNIECQHRQANDEICLIEPFTFSPQGENDHDGENDQDKARLRRDRFGAGDGKTDGVENKREREKAVM